MFASPFPGRMILSISKDHDCTFMSESFLIQELSWSHTPSAIKNPLIFATGWRKDPLQLCRKVKGRSSNIKNGFSWCKSCSTRLSGSSQLGNSGSFERTISQASPHLFPNCMQLLRMLPGCSLKGRNAAPRSVNEIGCKQGLHVSSGRIHLARFD